MSMIGWFLQVSPATLEDILNHSTRLEEIIDNDGAESKVDVEKSWEAIHFLLTGEGITDGMLHPMKKIVFGIHTVDEDQDLGYGPAGFLSADEVAAAASELLAFTGEEMAARYDGEKMNEMEIYPGGWETADNFKYLMVHFRALQDFYAAAAEKGNAIIMYIS